MKRLQAWFTERYYLLTVILMFLSFPSYDVWFLKAFPVFAWISLVPLFYFVRDMEMKRVYSVSFVTGLLGMFLVYNWIGDFGGRATEGPAVILVAVIPALALFFSAKIMLAEYLSRRNERLRMLIYPSVWILFDAMQAIGYLAFPWTYWAYSQYPFTPFIHLSSITGVFGITFLIVFTNSALEGCARKMFADKDTIAGVMKSAEGRSVLAALAVVIVSTGYGLTVMAMHPERAGSSERLKLAMVQTCIDPWDDWYNNRFMHLDKLADISRAAMEQGPDMIVWSESATLEPISYHYREDRPGQFDQEVLDLARELGRPILTGEIGMIEDSISARLYPQNNAVLINGSGEVVSSYPKIYLVPMGEWFPYGEIFPAIQEITNSYGGSNFVPGDTPMLFEACGRKFGPLICYEGIFFHLCRVYRTMGAEFFINITNLYWTRTWRGHMQGFASAKFRAIENGIWFVSAGNSGFTALVDPYGRVKDSIPILEENYLVGSVDFALNHRTPYIIMGDAVLYAALGFVMVLLIAGILERLPRRKVP